MPESKANTYPNITQSFGITGIVVLGVLLLSPVLIILKRLIGEEASFFIYYLLAIGIPFLVVYSIRKKKTGSNSFNLAIENRRVIPFIIVGTIALFVGIDIPIGNLIPMPESIKEMLAGFGSQTGIFTFLAMVIAAPILEELIFRGIILDGLLKNYSPIKSIFISSFLFGLVHLNPWQFLGGLLFGSFIGWVYYRSKSLSLSIIIHAVVNLSGFLMRFFVDFESIMDETLLEAYGGLTNLILAIVGSVIILSICIYLMNKEFNKKEKEISVGD